MVRVPSNNKICMVRVPSNNKVCMVRVPSNNKICMVRVPSNNNYRNSETETVCPKSFSSMLFIGVA